MAKDKRLNARVSADIDRKLREIVEATGSSLSQIIMDAIELYYRQGAAPSGESPYEIAKRSGVIGCLRGGPADLSARYKEILAESLSTKHK